MGWRAGGDSSGRRTEDEPQKRKRVKPFKSIINKISPARESPTARLTESSPRQLDKVELDKVKSAAVHIAAG
jgi:hypothetical protein